jgi:hypothetical protein
VLHVQAGDALLREVLADVAVARTRAADAVREHDQRRRSLAGRPVQARRHGPLA